MKSVRLIYFSPTGTTRTVLQAIADGIAPQAVEHLDITLIANRAGRVMQPDGALTLIGVPVYTGRVPIQAAKALRSIKATGAPAVIVVVYANRAYEDALLELKQIVDRNGFVTIAAAAFIGEHSFSTSTIPLASGRPDEEDRENARIFGKRVRERIERMNLTADARLRLEVPGNFPYRKRMSLRAAPGTMQALCLYCGRCGEVCPQNAITMSGNRLRTRRDRCILCCACVKACPTGARQINNKKISQVIEKLISWCRDRKEPEFFFAE
jgi:ferredoxin